MPNINYAKLIDGYPAYAPNLWVKINYKDGVRVIPDVISAAPG